MSIVKMKQGKEEQLENRNEKKAMSEGEQLNNSFESGGGVKVVRSVLNAISVMVILAIGMSMGNKLAAMKKPAEKVMPQARTLKASVMDVTLGSHTVSLTGQGTVAAKSELNIIPEVSGKLTYVNPEFREGGFVSKGDILFKVDQANYLEVRKRILANIGSIESDIRFQENQNTSLKSELSETKKTWEVSNVETERMRRLVNRGAASEAELNRMVLSERANLERIENYNTRIALIDPTIEKLEAAIVAQKSQLATINLSIERTVYRAPFSGTVSGAGYEKGQFIGEGQVLARLFDDSTYEIPVPLSVSDFRKLGIGDESRDFIEKPVAVKVLWKGGNGENAQRWEGRIVRLGSSLDASTKLLDVIVEVDSASDDGMKLVPGMFVEVRFTGATLENVAVLPRRAMRNNDKVYVVKDGKMAVQPVDVWGKSGNHFIVSDGLQDGVQVITSVVDEPTPGLPVTVLSINSAH